VSHSKLLRSIGNHVTPAVLDDHLLRDLAAAEYLQAPLCVWVGDDGPRLRAAMASIGGEYRTISS